MCGIAGLFASRGQQVSSSHIQQMMQLVRHRGPDDAGYVIFNRGQAPLILADPDTPQAVLGAPYPYCPKVRIQDNASGNALLGHRRLSIIDLSPAGHQPMCSEHGHVWISYNGEIFNYVELRAELKQLGQHFITQSDTEVILRAYEVWGESCLHRFNGMFAFVIYDARKQIVFAARDRFGVKPCYFWKSPQGVLAIASEIKQFTCLPGWQAMTNNQAVYDYLTAGATDHNSKTLFAGVNQLRGGECLHFDITHDCFQIRSWYNLPTHDFIGTEEEAAAQFRELFSDAIRLRLRSDVDVGFCLSGGLDSSSIVCLANQHLSTLQASNRQKTFSACAREKAFDERHYMEMVSGHCKLESHYTYPTLEHLFDEAPLITWHQDEPFGSTSIYAQWRVFELAKQQGVKVMLDGQGADEQLAGYMGFFKHHLAELFFRGRWLRFFQEASHIRQRHGEGIIPSGSKAFTRLLKYLVRSPKQRLGQASHWLDVQGLQVKDHPPHGGHPHEPVRDQCARQLRYSLPSLLRYEDRNSMAQSIESRTPFLDYRLVEFISSLPGHYRISQGITKRVLREGMRDVLPEEIRMRMDKLGFATPEEVWIKQHQPQRFLQQVETAYAQSQGILKPGAKDLAKDIVSGSRPFSFLVWRMVNFGIWMERFNVRSGISR